MSKVAEIEKLEVSQLEILEQAKMMADMFGGGDRVWQNIGGFRSPGRAFLPMILLSNKVIHRLAAIAKGEALKSNTAEKSAAETGQPTAESEAVSAPDEGPEPNTAEEK
ncbi:MAG: hypothetical protein U0401_03440 [Anaerolineae bacterium]